MNLLDNLWNIAHKTSKTISDNADPENEHTAKALSAIMDTAGSVGKDVASLDPSKTEGKSTVDGFVGFFENLGDQSITDLGRLADSALTDLTADPWVQNQVAGGLSQILTGEAITINVDGGPADDPYGDYYDDDNSGACEVEYSANYMGGEWWQDTLTNRKIERERAITAVGTDTRDTSSSPPPLSLPLPFSELLNDGHQTIARDEGECCRMCQATAGCSVWVYCGSPNGCGAPYYKQGECYLKKSSVSQQRRAARILWAPGNGFRSKRRNHTHFLSLSLCLRPLPDSGEEARVREGRGRILDLWHPRPEHSEKVAQPRAPDPNAKERHLRLGPSRHLAL